MPFEKVIDSEKRQIVNTLDKSRRIAAERLSRSIVEIFDCAKILDQ